MIRYAITDRQNFSFDHLDRDLQRLSSKADMIVYRDKHNAEYAGDAALFAAKARHYPFKKILLHTDILLASRLEVDGVHLSSGQFDEIAKAKEYGLFVIISCHTIEEASRAEILGADMITYSPIYASPGKGRPLGLGALKELKGIITLPIIALGGIVSEVQITACREAGASGFASIRFFQ